MANLQDQLGLGLVAKQTAKMNNTPKYSFQSKDALTGGVQISAGIAEPQQIDLGGGPAYYNNSSSRDGSLPIQDSFNQSYSAPASVSTPESTTNMSIADTSSGITRKKNTNIAETIKQVAPVGMQIESPVIPENKLQSFKDATQGQDVQFRQSYRQSMNTPKPLDSSGLSGAELQAYNMLNPQEQAQYKALATQGMKAQTDYLTKSKANIEYQKSQEEQRLAMEDNADAISDIMSQKNIEESQKQVANLKQNIGYLGSGGQPGVSSQKLDAISNQVTLADRTLKNIIEVERLQKANRELGQEKNAEIFTRQIKILQDDLDSKVNKTVQGALNQFNSAELEGKLDTIPEIEAFQQQLYAQLDGDLSSIMDTNIEARQFLIERYDKLAESQKAQMQANEKAKADYQKNSNTLNKDMSEALGYYVNANGEALVDKKTGQNIVVPPESSTNYDASTGQMIIMTKNRDGSIGVQVKQVGSGKPVTPEWKQTENGNWYNANSTTNPQFQSIDRQSAIGKYGSTPAVRNFNPGNIMDTGFGGQKVEGERFTVFSSPQEGFNALVAKIQNIQNGGSKVYSPDMTLLQYIGKYAPSSDNNNPQGYANAIANNLGISINTKIGQIDPVKLAEEHARHEDGNSYRMLKDIGIIGGGETPQSITSEEIRELDALASITNLGKEDRKRQLILQNKFNTANDLAKQKVKSYSALNRLISNEGLNQGTSDKDVKYLREALSDYMKTGNEQVILDSIEARIINAKDKTPLKGIQDYAKIKLYADALNKYAETNDPNVFKSMQTTLYAKFGLPTEQTEYKSFLENGNLNEVLRIAGTSFTDSFIERVNNITVNPKDTPKSVADKMNGLLKKAELEVSGAKRLIGDETLNKIYPGAFTDTPTFGGTGGTQALTPERKLNIRELFKNALNK